MYSRFFDRLQRYIISAVPVRRCLNDYARNVRAGLSLIESVAEAWQPV